MSELIPGLKPCDVVARQLQCASIHHQRFLDVAALIEESNKVEIRKAGFQPKRRSREIPGDKHIGIQASQHDSHLATTFFIKQGFHMNRKIGGGGLQLPPASTFLCITGFSTHAVLPRIGIVMTMLAMVIAVLVKRKPFRKDIDESKLKQKAEEKEAVSHLVNLPEEIHDEIFLQLPGTSILALRNLHYFLEFRNAAD
ncbi:hypothetical protein C5167_001103 [Papaver somniferum]|uniref:F-box domain-containing protein n=1 Tax=Papaver somniferum TaxID=3469 RepID=A0A4Y7KV01_PAPSO|nr:hypothetical protein C5167_001103 [Papaver somniferum]